jgi:hypothetical protein
VEKTWIEEERENGNCNNGYDRFLEKIFMRPIKLYCPQQNGIISGTHQTLSSEVINLFLRFLMNVTSGSSTGYPVSSDE